MKLENVVLISQMAPLIATMILSLSDCITNVLKSMVGIDRILELFELTAEEDGGEAFVVCQSEKGLETKGLVGRYRDHSVRIADIDITFEDGGWTAADDSRCEGKRWI